MPKVGHTLKNNGPRHGTALGPKPIIIQIRENAGGLDHVARDPVED